MTLRQQQSRFAELVGQLIVWAYANGYELTFGDAWAKSGHIPASYHYKRLAIDLNLFINGKYMTSTESHRPLGEYWKSLDPMATWGGDWGGDGNHYSYNEI